jgi:hypothetical protein
MATRADVSPTSFRFALQIAIPSLLYKHRSQPLWFAILTRQHGNEFLVFKFGNLTLTRHWLVAEQRSFFEGYICTVTLKWNCFARYTSGLLPAHSSGRLSESLRQIARPLQRKRDTPHRRIRADGVVDRPIVYIHITVILHYRHSKSLTSYRKVNIGIIYQPAIITSPCFYIGSAALLLKHRS